MGRWRKEFHVCFYPQKNVWQDSQKTIVCFWMFTSLFYSLTRFFRTFLKDKVNLCLNRIVLGQIRYLKSHVIHSPVPKHSPCDLVIMLGLISMSCSHLVARALSWRLIEFWVYPFTRCLGHSPSNSVTQSFLTWKSNTYCDTALALCSWEDHSVAFRVLPKGSEHTGVCFHFLLYLLTNRSNVHVRNGAWIWFEAWPSFYCNQTNF